MLPASAVHGRTGGAEVCAPKLNDAINAAVCQRDALAAVASARLRIGAKASTLHAMALRQSARRRQPYLGYGHYMSMLLLRSGT